MTTVICSILSFVIAYAIGSIISKNFYKREIVLHIPRRAYKNTLDAINFHPRAWKLMKKKKEFIVIAIDEPYYINAYKMIRDNEIKRGRWTAEDEKYFIQRTTS